jgi:predicted small lipoprotein YifL
MKVFMPAMLVSVMVLALTACGPKPEPEPPPPPEPTAEELAQMHEQKLMPYREVVQKFNDAVWEIKPDLFAEAVTEDTYDLFIRRTELEMALADEEGEATAESFLEKQRDYKIVYYIKDIDEDTGIAVVEGVVEGEVQFETQLMFVEEDGQLEIDHSEVLTNSVAELEEALEEKHRLEEIAQKIRNLVEDHGVAIAEGDVELFEATVSTETAELAVEYLRALPKKKGGKRKGDMEDFVEFKQDRIEKVEVKDVDPVEMTVTVIHHPVIPKKLKKGQEPPQPFEKVIPVVENEQGGFVLDCSAQLEKKIQELEED